MTRRINLIIFLFACAISCTTKKEDPKPEQPKVERPLLIEASLSEANLETTALKTRALDVFLKTSVSNLVSEQTRLSDSVFVWEMLNKNTPKDWDISVCCGDECHTSKIVKGEFIIRKGQSSKFEFTINSIDAINQTTQAFGEGTLTAEYVVYRKGMNKEDGLKINVKLSTK
ncbi:MAG: hypothetical protein EAZ07_01785 [Cytophagales bacterium]|nr:MAG: hypothetical protein EAZ07_01785 [Cytophagales bacterium]